MPAWFEPPSPRLRRPRTFFLAARPECRALRGVSKGAACKKYSPQPARHSHERSEGDGWERANWVH